MTDKEMLELAAKAAGIFLPMDFDPKHHQWNPFTDDGDALRLAVRLMDFQPYKGRAVTPFISSDASVTRRVITIAAATIGKEMK